VVLDPKATGGRSLLDVMTAAMAGGARLFQYRDKAASMREVYDQVIRLRQAASEAGAIFVVNDRCDLALAVDAHGVHLGQDDLPLALARSIMGKEKLIGISTHRAEQVIAATEGGADYLGFGPIYETGTKPDHEPVVGTEGLRRIRSLTSLPIFAIGGITLERIEGVMEAGANGIAVISALAGAPDIASTVRTFLERCSRRGRPGSESRDR
jgi:thiamine-phosphate pyrophosphorylase